MDVVRKIESNKTDGRDKPVKEVIVALFFRSESALNFVVTSKFKFENLSSAFTFECLLCLSRTFVKKFVMK